jgi:uncharacterized damage-inducible protein DinB
MDMKKSENYLAIWKEARTRFENLLPGISENDLKKKIPGISNSAGFLIRHIAEVELLFSKNVFGLAEVKVHAKTVIAQRDTGEWDNLWELMEYKKNAGQWLEKAILSQTDDDWDTLVTTKQFGSKTKYQVLGRIISHTAYHAGQLALIIKYGK